jgi:hypothetical protein
MKWFESPSEKAAVIVGAAIVISTLLYVLTTPYVGCVLSTPSTESDPAGKMCAFIVRGR